MDFTGKLQAVDGKIKLSLIKPNPNNPRVIKDHKFENLVKSIKEFPKMMEMRPMVVNSDFIVLGGNMRLKALKEAGYKDIPIEWVKSAESLNEDEQRRFIIADNIGFGEDDWDVLKAEWDLDELESWGMDIPNFKDDQEDLPEEEKTFIPTYKFEVTCNTEKEKTKLMADLMSKGFSCTDDY